MEKLHFHALTPYEKAEVRRQTLTKESCSNNKHFRGHQPTHTYHTHTYIYISHTDTHITHTHML
jgi:hypothetical protein